jgi:hypothetical protein
MAEYGAGRLPKNRVQLSLAEFSPAGAIWPTKSAREICSEFAPFDAKIDEVFEYLDSLARGISRLVPRQIIEWAAIRNSVTKPIHQKVSSLNTKNIGIGDWEKNRLNLRLEQALRILECPAVSAVIRKYDYRPWPRTNTTPGAALSLNER